MNRITSPLKLDMQGTTVVDLQDASKLVLDRGVILRDDEDARRELSAALESEHSIHTYGGATRKLVGIFQEAHHLDVRIGEVDERTVTSLNAALIDPGAFDAPPEIQKCVVAGWLLQEDQSPFKDAVVLFHEGDQDSIRWGEDGIGSGGHYTIRYESLLGVGNVNDRVDALDEAGRTVKNSDVVRGAGTIQIIDLAVLVMQSTTDARLSNDPFVMRYGIRPARQGIAGHDVLCVLFPNSGQPEQHPDATTIKRLCKPLLDPFGGTERVRRCAASLAP